MVVITSIIAGVLSLDCDEIGFIGQDGISGLHEYDMATLAWLALFHLCIFMVHARICTGADFIDLRRWPYLLIAVSVSFGWTLLLDGQTQFISYICSIVIGLICGAI